MLLRAARRSRRAGQGGSLEKKSVDEVQAKRRCARRRNNRLENLPQANTNADIVVLTLGPKRNELYPYYESKKMKAMQGSYYASCRSTIFEEMVKN